MQSNKNIFRISTCLIHLLAPNLVTVSRPQCRRRELTEQFLVWLRFLRISSRMLTLPMQIPESQCITDTNKVHLLLLLKSASATDRLRNSCRRLPHSTGQLHMKKAHSLSDFLCFQDSQSASEIIFIPSSQIGDKIILMSIVLSNYPLTRITQSKLFR